VKHFFKFVFTAGNILFIHFKNNKKHKYITQLADNSECTCREVCWLTPVIPAKKEVEIEGSESKASPGRKSETLSGKHSEVKWTGCAFLLFVYLFIFLVYWVLNSRPHACKPDGCSTLGPYSHPFFYSYFLVKVSHFCLDCPWTMILLPAPLE
jgi:hypothetical protein